MSQNTDRLAAAQLSYQKAKDENDIMKDVENMCQRRVLSENAFFVSEIWPDEKRRGINEPSEDYLMDDESFERYSALVHEEYRIAGYDIPAEKTATYLTAPALRAAEDELIDAAIPFMPDVAVKAVPGMRNHWKYRAQLIELNMSLDPRFVGTLKAHKIRASVKA